MTVERAAYIAGILDADGHIGWRGGKYQAPDVGVTNTSDALVAWLHLHVGGSFHCERRAGMDAPDGIRRRRDIYRWHLTGQRACILLRACRPFLVIKGSRADDVLTSYEQMLATMQRPKRRQHHIDKETAAMKQLGWD